MHTSEQKTRPWQLAGTTCASDKTNAANVEESAAASEELNAQAEQMKHFVEELVKLVEGKTTHLDRGIKDKRPQKNLPRDRKKSPECAGCSQDKNRKSQKG